ncbi:MAG: DegV family protein [Anaerolineae bacterium]|nr:DegV family protein [Thermoflexales bacterium]MDW8396496.1 DegV family protein [Anaerolineae bacterium]
MVVSRPSRVRVVTDSSADVSAEWAQAHGVIVLPHCVEVAGRVWREGVDLTQAELAQYAARSSVPFAVSAPSVEAFAEVYLSLSNQRADVISIHVSASLSDAVKNAAAARESFLGSCAIHVLDSRTASAGLGEIVKAGVTLAERGLDAEAIVRTLRGLTRCAYGVFLSDEMEYLERSKRLRPAQAILGRMLGIIPYLVFEEGELIAPEKVRTLDRGYEKLAEFVSEFDPATAHFFVVQLSPQPSPRTRALIEALHLSMPRLGNVPIRPAGAALGSVLGPNGLGVIIYDPATG